MSPYATAHSVELVHSGEDYFQRLKALISGAETVIHLQTYIFDWDETGREVADWLMQAAGRGVKIFMLIDRYGSDKLPEEAVATLEKAGIRFRFFAPLGSVENLAFGRRLHHKIVVADEKIALIGGINMANRYRIGVETDRPWLDFAIQVKGEICGYPHLVCQRIYEKKSQPWHMISSLNTDKNKRGPQVTFLRNDWLRRKTQILHSYRNAVQNAEHRIVMAASYFLPEKSFRRLLARAAARGVEIKIILSGPSDVPLARYAEHYLHRFLLSKGIRVFEWRPSVLHAKVMVVDGRWTTVGSYNLNHLSRYRSIEFNGVINDEPFAEKFQAQLDVLIEKDCTEITPENSLVMTSRWHRFKSWLAFGVFRSLVVVFISRRAYDS